MLPWIRHNAYIHKVTAYIFLAVAFVFLLIFFITPDISFAQVDPGTDFGLTEIEDLSIPTPVDSDIRVIIVRIINFLLGFLGLVAVVLMMYAGFIIMTSGGNEEQVARGKKMLINGVIGLIIIISAFIITSFIMRALIGFLSDRDTSGRTPPLVQTYQLSGALGKIIKDHYPQRNAINIPRNTSIVVTFGVPVDPSSLIEKVVPTCWNVDRTGFTTDCVTHAGSPVNGDTPLSEIADPYYGSCVDLDGNGIDIRTECDRIKNDVVKITTLADVGNQVGVTSSAFVSYDVSGNAFTFVFRPHEYLGSPVEDVTHRVLLSTAIMRGDVSESVFANQFREEGYAWDFTTNTTLDLDPPYVVDISPRDAESAPRNTIIQVVFNEAIDPTTVQGTIQALYTGGFHHAIVNREIGGLSTTTPGTWTLSNGYTTLEFTSAEACGLNSCGEQMFCLPVACDDPSNASCANPYEVLLRTAEWTGNAGAPFEAVPFSGIYDLAFNGLDNRSDNDTSSQLKKPPVSDQLLIGAGERAPDNYWWGFSVQNIIDRTIPYVEKIIPGVDAEDVPGDAPLEVSFSTRMLSRTLSDIGLHEYPANVCADAAIALVDGVPACSLVNERLPDIWYRVGSVSDTVDNITKTRAIITHREFGPNNLDLYYFPAVPSTVKSITQNCVYPGRGPWENVPVSQEASSSCVVTYDDNGNVLTQEGCVGVEFDPEKDTGCVYTLGGGGAFLFDDDSLLKGTVDECLAHLRDHSSSSY